MRVGIFLIVALGLLGFGLFLIGETGHVFGERYRLVTLMRSAAGLARGAPVQVAGQAAGQVERVQFIEPEQRPSTGEAVAVWLAVDRELQAQIRADSRARVRTQGLLGDRLIDIEPGSPGARVLEQGDTLSSEDVLDYQELLDDAAAAMTDLTRMVRNLSRLTHDLVRGDGTLGRLVVDDALYRRLVSLGGSLDRFLERATSGEGFVGRMLEDDTLYERLVSATASLDSLTMAAVDGRGSLGRLLRSDSLYEAVLGMATRSDSLLSAMERGEGALGKLLVEDEMYEEILRSLVELNNILRDLRRDPRKYIPPVRVF